MLMIFFTLITLSAFSTSCERLLARIDSATSNIAGYQALNRWFAWMTTSAPHLPKASKCKMELVSKMSFIYPPLQVSQSAKFGFRIRLFGNAFSNYGILAQRWMHLLESYLSWCRYDTRSEITTEIALS